MLPSAGDELRVKPGGLLVAAVAFALTRTLVVSAIYARTNNSLPLQVVKLLPLVLGLGVVLYGVDLAFGTRPRSYARTVAAWYLVGTIGMLALLAVGSVPDVLGTLADDRTAANAVVAGGIVGIFVGIRTATARDAQTALTRQTDQVVLLNRLLRHEVLNAITAIRGHAGLVEDDAATDRSFEVIRDGVDRIQQTVGDVGFLVRSVDETGTTLTSVDPTEHLSRATAALSTEAAVTVESPAQPVLVRGDEHLTTVFRELLAIALEPVDTRAATVSFDVDATTVDVRLTAPGEWLQPVEREVLLEGLPEYDRPDIEYGIPITHLLVAQYGGALDVEDDATGTTVVVTLPRTTEHAPESDRPGVSPADRRVATAAGLAAGLVMGVVVQTLSGSIDVIGALYGLETLTVGWIVHLFHSVVFAIVFVAVLSTDRLDAYTASLPGVLALAVAYSIGLWLLAAGVIMGVWLTLVGIPADIPNLGTLSLLGHLVWGVTVGGVVALSSTTRPV